MAAVTVGSLASQVFDRKFAGLRERVALVTGGNGDTYNSGVIGIDSCYWRPSTSADACALTWSATTGVVTINSGGTVTGVILIKSKR